MIHADIVAHRPLLAVVLPTLAVVGIVATRRWPNVREGVTMVATLATFATVASMVPDVLAGEVFVVELGGFVPGIDFTLRADRLGILFAALASFLWIVTSLYSVGYMRGLDEHAQTRYFAAFAASIATAMGVAFAANLVTLFVFYELLSVATYPLVAHDETDEAIWAGRKYLVYTFGGGIAALAGTVVIFGLTGTTAFAPGGIVELATADETAARVAFALLIAGFGVKAALVPIHSWLPDAMVAPTPVSALLHAVAVVKSGVFAIARVVLDVFGPELVDDLGVGIPLAVVASVTILTASVIALRQDNLKRRLAYSTVSQLSYIVLGLAIFSPYALIGGLLHIPAHAFMKITLFFCAGAIHVETHTDDVSDMAGIARRMPLTMSAFAVAAAGMAGMPLLVGFVSKWYVVVGSFSAGHAIFAGVLLLSGVLNVGYYWPVVYQAFFEDPVNPDPKPLIEHPPGGRWATAAVGAAAGARSGAGTALDGGHGRASAVDGGRDEGAGRFERVAGSDEGGRVNDENGRDDDGTHENPVGRYDEPASRPEASEGADATFDEVAERDDARTDHRSDGHRWERRTWWTESTWFMLGPIVACVAGAVVLGIAPDAAFFLELVQEIVAERGVMP